MTLLDEIADAEAKLAELRRRAATATCAEAGHRWKCVGGRNAGCGPYCSCSVPVHECEVCGDSDYGQPAAEADVIQECHSLRPDAGKF